MANDSAKKLKELRDRAEQLLSESPKGFKDIPAEDIQNIIHELQVHQIELEMQNEELRRTQAELEESRNRYVDLYDFAPVGYVTVDQNLLVIEANLSCANLLGIERSRLMNKGLSHYIAEDYRHKYYSTARQGFETRERQTCQLKLIKKDGTEFYAQLECIVVQDSEGNFNQIRITITDISERVRAEEALKEHSERLEEIVKERTKDLKDAQDQLIRKEKLSVLGQLAGGVGHELRNPLGVISNAVYYLKMVLPDADETAKEYLDMIASEVRNSEKTVSDLLGISRTRPAEREKIALSELFNQVLEKQPPPEGIKVTTEIPPALPPIFVDPHQIGQVLFNLVTNAFQAMPEGGLLTINADELRLDDTIPIPRSEIRIRVSDSGSGISKENMNKLFEPLFTTKARGIGIGLAVSKNLVEVNGGSIEVESEEGKGSIFTVVLPTKEVQS